MARQAQSGDLVGGRYRLVAMLGSQRRWQARDEHHGADVAVERTRLSSVLAAAERATLFERGRTEREARQVAALRASRNLVFVDDVVADEDVLWSVTRLVEGRTLAEDVSAYGPLAPEAALLVAADLLKGLAAAHEAGITHGDISPATVMLAGSGDALLTGFDAAQALTDEVACRAPERERGQEAQAPGDLFSLGATLHLAVEGDSPSDPVTAAETVAAARSLAAEPAERAGQLGPLIARMLATDPAQRPTAREALALLEPPPAPAEPASPVAPSELSPVPPGEPQTYPIKEVAAIVLLVGAFLAVVVLGLNQHEPSSQKSATAPTTTTKVTYTYRAPTTRAYVSPTTSDTYVPPTTTTRFDPSSLDAERTDSTPVTVAALLPDEFTDSKGVKYTMQAGGVHDCVTKGESAAVKKVLARVNCTQAVDGVYLDRTDTIMVWVVVAPISDVQTASAAYGDLSHAHSGDWGIRCPTSGAGSKVCNAPSDNINSATQYSYIRRDHRYLIHSLAIYVSLGQGSVNEPWVDAASLMGVNAAGPDNYR